jgi:hypothetical protein
MAWLWPCAIWGTSSVLFILNWLQSVELRTKCLQLFHAL